MHFDSSAARPGAAWWLLAGVLLPGLAFTQTLNEQQELFASLTAGAGSGTAVAIAGSTAVVGVPNDNSGAGDVYIFTRSGTTWSAPVIIAASDGAANDNFGASVSISSFSNGSGSTPIIAVGAPGRQSGQGAVYTFSFNGSNWVQGSTLTTGAAGNKLGTSVSIQGLTLAAGAPYATVNGNAAAGTAVVFTSNNGGLSWSPQALRENKGQTKANNNFGKSVSVSGNTVLVGSPNEKAGSKAAAGQTYVFVNSTGSWRQQTRLSPNGLAANAHSGAAVALYADTAVIGAPGTSNGDAYVYTRTGTSWSAGAHLGSGAASGDNYGASVAVSGTGIVVGAPLATNAGAGSGRAYEYTLVSGTTYTTNELVAIAVATTPPSQANAAGDNFGASVAIDAGYALVGAPVANAANGAAYVFAPPPASITTTTTITSMNGGAPDQASLIGQSYLVSVQVSGSLGIPNGTVNVDDGAAGDTCTITLTAGAGSCTLTNSVAGLLQIDANYSGAGLFLPSTATPLTHTVNGPTLQFAASTADILQGDRLGSVQVQVLLAGVLDTADNTTQVTVDTTNPCDGTTVTLGTLTVSGGIADFTGFSPRFYTLTSGGTYQLNASSTDAGFAPASNFFDVVTNTVDPSISADGFESCRL